MSPARRDVLHSLGGGLLVALSGCLYDPLVDSSGQQFDSEDYVEDWHEDPLQAQGDPIEVDQCGRDAVDDVESAVHERANAASSIEVGYIKSEEMPDWYIYVSRVIVLGPNGEVRQIPEVSFETILNATPDSVVKPIDGDQDYTCPEEVYVYDSLRQMD